MPPLTGRLSFKGMMDIFKLFKRKKTAPEPPNFTWWSPGIDVLSQPQPSNSGKEYTGEYVRAALEQAGIKSVLVSSTFGAAVAQHHFTLPDIKHMRRIKAALPSVGALLHTTVTQGPSSVGHFSLEVPRMHRQFVGIRRAMLTKGFADMPFGLSACLGTDTANMPLCINIADMPHLLIAGATGSGKSVCINTIINSILFKSTPTTVRMLLIDPKQVEMSQYEGIPQLLQPIIKGPSEAVEALQGVCFMMDKRYENMAAQGHRNAAESNYPQILIVIDELADLMFTSKKAVETAIVRIAQLGRAAGIHLVVATQRPTVNVITGLIKANIPARIALQTASYRDSMTILDRKGAEALTGKGDALLKLPDRVDPIRFQSAYIGDNDIAAVCDYWRSERCKQYDRP